LVWDRGRDSWGVWSQSMRVCSMSGIICVDMEWGLERLREWD
jgi:hypothetical protein